MLLDGNHDDDNSFFFFFSVNQQKSVLFLSDHYNRVMSVDRRGWKKWQKKIILAIFSFFQDNLCVFRGWNRRWASHTNVYLPLLFLLLLRPWYSHCLKSTFCVNLFDEKQFFRFVIMLFIFLVFVWSCSFCGKLKLMLFIFYSIRKCNLIWRRWSGCVCVRMSVWERPWMNALVCIQWVNQYVNVCG